MLLLSTNPRRDRGGRDGRAMSRVFHWPGAPYPQDSGTKARTSLPIAQILASRQECYETLLSEQRDRKT